MRDVKRIRPLMERLISAWEQHPDLRLGQMIVFAAPDQEPFYIEDEQIIAAIERMLAEQSERDRKMKDVE